jgi:hypothetical protein
VTNLDLLTLNNPLVRLAECQVIREKASEDMACKFTDVWRIWSIHTEILYTLFDPLCRNMDVFRTIAIQKCVSVTDKCMTKKAYVRCPLMA